MAPNKVQIINRRLSPTQLREIVEVLGQEGYFCIVSETFDDSIAESPLSGVKLILLGVADEDLPELLAEIRVINGQTSRVPVLVCLNQQPSKNSEVLISPEIDDFLILPLHLSALRLRIQRLVRQSRRMGDEGMAHLRKRTSSQMEMPRLIGQAPAFAAVKDKLPRVAACDATVLLAGETGTGKEMCARTIHYFSPRVNGPFVPLNCSAIPTELFENELFGHESGAFTDARQPRRGLIAEAEGGTLFLDEVDSLPLSAQVKLLRFLQDRQYKPLGSSRYRQADVRLVAASNQDLQAKVREQHFREDLFFRLNLITLRLPPLRERREDIIPLGMYFLEQAAREYHRQVSRFSQNAVMKLMAYPWPGNVRELENVIRQAVIFAEGGTIRDHELNMGPTGREANLSWKEPFNIAKARMIENFEQDYLRRVLVACGGNISQAARQAQKDRRTFFGLLKKYGLTHIEKAG